MELVSFTTSRVTSLLWATPATGQSYLPRTSKALVEKYAFVGFPTNLVELTSNPVSYKYGSFNGIAIDTLDIFEDGIVVISRSHSDVLDSFIDDLLQFAQELGFKIIKPHKINKMYESHIVVRSDKDLLKALDPLGKLQSLIADGVKKTTKANMRFHAFGLTLSIDAYSATGLRPTVFRVERKIDLPFDSSYYVSSAPLPTNLHLEALEALENLT